MAKKFLALLIVLVMVLSMIPAVSAAEETTEVVIPSYTVNDAGWVAINGAGKFNDWFRATTVDSIISASDKLNQAVDAKLVLTNDVSMNVLARIGNTLDGGEDDNGNPIEDRPDPVHNIIIDMNGHNITATGNHRVFEVYNSNLTIINSKEEGGNITAAGAYNAVGGMFYVNNGSLTLSNVNLYRTKATASTIAKGGILGTNKSVVLLQDCVLDASGSASVQQGGVLYVANYSDVTLNNCEIKGGSVYTGLINNKADTTDRGGNVYIAGGTVTMNGGTISGGRTPYRGGNIYLDSVSSTFVLNYGTVEDGIAQDTEHDTGAARGSNIYVYKGTVIMHGGTIKNGNYLKGDYSSYNVNGANMYLESNEGTYFYMYGGELVHETCLSFSGAGGNMTKGANAVALLYGGKFTLPSLTSKNRTFTYEASATCSTVSEWNENGEFIITPNNTPVAGEVVAATCTAAGYTNYKCADCEDTFIADIVAPTGHTPVAIDAKSATCTE